MPRLMISIFVLLLASCSAPSFEGDSRKFDPNIDQEMPDNEADSDENTSTDSPKVEESSEHNSDSADEIEDGEEDAESDATMGWTSGGGGVLGFQGNPWFVGNQQNPITYCVVVDQENFSDIKLSKEQWAARIQKALQFWSKEFRYAQTSFSSFLHEKQYDKAAYFPRFDEEGFAYQEDCQETTDITFQLGMASPQQRAYLTNRFGEVIAAAVRTSYDQESMKGQGFVYVSPEKGDWAPKLNELLDQRWSNEQEIFEKVLIHEIGHVFGLQHLAQTIMDHEYVDKVVSVQNSLSSDSIAQTSFYDFLPDSSFVLCKDPFGPPMNWPRGLTWDLAFESMGLSTTQDCAEFVLAPEDWNLEIYGYNSQEANRKELASMTDFSYSLHCSPLYFRDATITINLPSNQKIFDTTLKRLHGPAIINGFTCNRLRNNFLFRDPSDPTAEFRQAYNYMSITSDKISLTKESSYLESREGFDFNVYANDHSDFLLNPF